MHATLEGSDGDDKSAYCETLLMELEAAILDGHRNVDVTMISAFNTHNRQYRINKGYASMDDTDIILIKTDSSVRTHVYNIYEHLEVHSEDLMPEVTPLTAHDVNHVRQLCSEVLVITQPETLSRLRRGSDAGADRSRSNSRSDNAIQPSANVKAADSAEPGHDAALEAESKSQDLNGDEDPMVVFEKKLLAIEGIHLSLREPKARDAKVKIANEQRGIVIGGRHRSVSDAASLFGSQSALAVSYGQQLVNDGNQIRAAHPLYSAVAAKECLFDYFHAELKFINALTGVSGMLKDLGLKKKELKSKSHAMRGTVTNLLRRGTQSRNQEVEPTVPARCLHSHLRHKQRVLPCTAHTARRGICAELARSRPIHSVRGGRVGKFNGRGGFGVRDVHGGRRDCRGHARARTPATAARRGDEETSGRREVGQWLGTTEQFR